MRNVTWTETVVLDLDDKVLLIFVNQIYSIPHQAEPYEYTLVFGKKKYQYLKIIDVIKKKGVQRKIYVKQL